MGSATGSSPPSTTDEGTMDHEMNCAKFEPIRTNSLPPFMICRVRPFVQPGRHPGSIASEKQTQAQKTDTNGK